MPTLDKETKKKASVFKMQLITEEHVFLSKTYYKTSSYLEINEAFRWRFPEKDPPTNQTIYENAKNTKEKEKVSRKDLAEGEQSGPKKLSKFLD